MNASDPPPEPTPPPSFPPEPFPLQDGPVAIDGWTPARVDRIRPWLRPDAEWKEWDAPALPGPADAEASRFAAGLVEHPWQPDPLTGQPQRLCVTYDAAAIGLVSWHWEDESSGWRRVGIVLYDPANWGVGIGTRALRLWSDWLATLPDTRRLDLATWPGNVRMIRAARTCGFTDETRLPDDVVLAR
jgi:RimJ/RimL family protein N-acetyltransferase